MKRILLFWLVLGSCHLSFSQDTTTLPKLELQTSYFKGNTFYGPSRILSKSEVRQLLNGKPKAIRLFENGLRQQGNATLLTFAGSALVAWPIGAAIAGANNPGWGIAAAGVGVVGVSIPIYNGGSKKIRQALDHYNGSLARGRLPSSSEINVSLQSTGNEVGLAIYF